MEPVLIKSGHREGPNGRNTLVARPPRLLGGGSHLARTLKLSDETYERLNRLAGRIRAEEGRPTSLDAAIACLLDEQEGASPLDFAGAWEMSPEEAADLLRVLDEVWSTWRIGS